MSSLQIGRTKITRIEELIAPLDPQIFFPDWDLSIIDKHRHWLEPNHVQESGMALISIHSWLIETPHHKILIDSCIGNDKDRLPFEQWTGMQSPSYLKNLQSAGVTADQIDFVLCTHLHVDHVGWNTRLQNGQWVPTFPNARYMFSQAEFDWMEAKILQPSPELYPNAGENNEVNFKTFNDSILPIMHLAELISGEATLLDGLVQIQPAPGHTPGSITVSLKDNNQEALFTGDIMHHVMQVYEPGWNSAYCEIPEQALTTRRRVLEHCLNSGALMLPAHFGCSHAGHVVSTDNQFGFNFMDS
jgi:glyoxylase-like metal-dependent hydrolase (beta-lactamase superfamily II)